MPRKLRLQAAGLPVHIIQRGNNRQACFFAAEDYRFFLDHLGKLTKRFHCSLHAYVLMTNHFHLLLSSDLPNGPSLLMKFLGQRYVQYVNRAAGRTGRYTRDIHLARRSPCTNITLASPKRRSPLRRTRAIFT